MRFYCDIMLGRLSKYLRMLGIDTAYSRTSCIEDIIDISTAQERILLTRRTLLPKINHKNNILVVRSNAPIEQTREVLKYFRIDRNNIYPFTLCLKCNAELVRVEKKDLSERLPDYIYNTNDFFSCCPCCGKVYWTGSHLKNMEAGLTDLFKDL